MKVLTAIAVLVLSVLSVIPAMVPLGWTPNPLNEGVTGYRVYRLDMGGSTNAVLLASFVATNRVDILLPDGSYRLAVTAVNARGDESALSSPPLFVFVNGTTVVGITNKPGAPIGLSIR